MRKLITLLILIQVSISCYSQTMNFEMSKTFEKELYTAIYQRAKELNISDSTRTIYTGLIIQKFKNVYPENKVYKTEEKEFIKLGEEITKNVLNDLNNPAKRAWTIEKEIILRNGLISANKNLGLELSNQNELLECITLKVMQTFPKGVDLNSADAEIIKILYEIGKDCGSEVLLTRNVFMKWTPLMEKKILDSLKKQLSSFEDLGIEKIKKLSHCIIDQLKITYPNGLDSKINTQEQWEKIMEKLAEECYEKINLD